MRKFDQNLVKEELKEDYLSDFGSLTTDERMGLWEDFWRNYPLYSNTISRGSGFYGVDPITTINENE